MSPEIEIEQKLLNYVSKQHTFTVSDMKDDNQIHSVQRSYENNKYRQDLMTEVIKLQIIAHINSKLAETQTQNEIQSIFSFDDSIDEQDLLEEDLEQMNQQEH